MHGRRVFSPGHRASGQRRLLVSVRDMDARAHIGWGGHYRSLNSSLLIFPVSEYRINEVVLH
jgi:hypothetical protein